MNISYAPLIEFHGFLEHEYMVLKEKLSTQLKKKLVKEDYQNVTFSRSATEVLDTSNKARPFLRMYSSEYQMIHVVVEILKNLKVETEVEFTKITNYFDLRKK